MKACPNITRLLAIVGPVLLAGEAMADRSIEVQGHRGARAWLPENTIAAFRHALEAGVDVIEMDVVVTRDDRLAVMHDLEVNPDLCLGPGGKAVGDGVAVRSLTFAELENYDCGTLKNPRFPDQKPVPGERVPALREVFDLVARSTVPAARTVRFNIEAKSVPARPDLSPEPRRFAAMILDAVKKAGMKGRVIVQSFDHRVLRAVRTMDPGVPVSALIAHTLPDLAAMAKDLGAAVVSPDMEWITKEAVDRLHRAGVRVVPWTANRKEDWLRLVRIGVDGIITDDPAGLIAFLKAGGMR